jgi:hypothetical protein
MNRTFSPAEIYALSVHSGLVVRRKTNKVLALFLYLNRLVCGKPRLILTLHTRDVPYGEVLALSRFR